AGCHDHAEHRAGGHRRDAAPARGRDDRRSRADLAGQPRTASTRAARRVAAAVGRVRGGQADRHAAAAEAGGGAGGRGQREHQVDVRAAEPGTVRDRARAARGRRAVLRRLVVRPPGAGQLHRAGGRLPVLAQQRQFDRGWHVGDPAQHRRRAGARVARRAAHGQGHPVEGTAAMSELDLLYTEVEEDLRGSVRSLLTDRCPPDAVAAMYDGDRSVVDTLWRAVAGELELAGLLVPEAHGGSRASAREAAVVLEELGRFVAPVPFLTSSVIATTVLLDSDSELLRQLASGERTAALAVPFSTAPDTVVPVVRADGGRLHGEVGKVAGAIEADGLLVPVASGDGWRVRGARGRGGRASAAAGRVVPVVSDDGGTVSAPSDATLTPVTSLDMSRQVADVRFDGVAAEPVVTDALQAVRRALRAGAALLASEQYGVASWCLHTTVEYLRQRRQFGRVGGSLQALKPPPA